MTNARRPILVALAAVLAAPASAEIEQRGDFYYDAEGRLASIRHVPPPTGDEREATSFARKLERMRLELPERPATLEPRDIQPKPSRVLEYEGQRRDRVFVKFTDDTPVRLRAGALQREGTRLPAFDAVAAAFPEARLERLFSQPEVLLTENRETGERIGGRALADLNNYYLLTFPGETARASALANALLALPSVEIAYLPSRFEPAGVPCIDVSPTTPDWTESQAHLDPRPIGIDAEYAWAYSPAGDGESTFWMIDVEWSWCFDHEDLGVDASDVVNGSTPNGNPGFDDPAHGTAAMSLYGACDNGFGVTGIAHDVTIKMADIDSEPSVPSTISTAAGSLYPGEVMLIEVVAQGPTPGTACTCNCQAYGTLPVEWDSAARAAIETATANGIVVVEPAANGSVDLDDPFYGGAFDPGPGSGALIVGASVPGTLNPTCWSNRGDTIDLHVGGTGIYAAGYGTLFSSGGCAQDYTSTFSGTSAAAAIIAGAAASVQNIANVRYGRDVSPSEMRSALQDTYYAGPDEGTGFKPQLLVAIDYIGPDLVPHEDPAWSFPLVPRETPDATPGSVTLQSGPLSRAGTYWNWQVENDSDSPTVNGPSSGVRRFTTSPWFDIRHVHANFAPHEVQTCLNLGPDYVKGGRHSASLSVNITSVEDEPSGAHNNHWDGQFIWAPTVLASNVPLSSTFTPFASPSLGDPYRDCEGFAVTTSSGFWHGIAAMADNAFADVDVRLHTETPANVPEAGFGSYVAESDDASNGAIDWVVRDANEVPAATFYGGIFYLGPINANAANKVVESDTDQGLLQNGVDGSSVGETYGPFTLPAGNLISLHELDLFDDTEVRVHVEVVSGNANFGVSVLDGTSGYHSKTSNLVSADENPGGEDEFVIVPNPGGAGDPDYYGLVVWKTDYAQLGESVTYEVHVSVDPNLASGVPAGWWGPIVPRNTTDATESNVPLPATLTGNETTTSFNWSVANEGAGDIAVEHETHLYVDDAPVWGLAHPGGTPSGAFAYALNSPQGLDPNSLVRGGRHHVRTRADVYGAVPEFDETDNDFVDWFVWTPLAMPEETPLQRAAPPNANPLGWGPYSSADGVRMPEGSVAAEQYWAATGVLSVSAADQYEVRIHDPSSGSRDGFGQNHEWSFSVPGEAQVVVANFNVAPRDAYDVGVLNWNAGSGDVVVQSTLSDSEGDVSDDWTSFGPFELGANEILNLHEVRILTGATLVVTVEVYGGDADVGLVILDQAGDFHTRHTGIAGANAAGPGEREAVTFGFPVIGGYYGFAVHKNGSADLAETSTYRLTFRNETVATEETAFVPTRYELLTPRPNPFATETAFGYPVPDDGGDVNVAVFDARGRRVATLVEGFRAAGSYTVGWDGRSAAGHRAEAGVYFVRLSAGSKTQTRKIALLE